MSRIFHIPAAIALLRRVLSLRRMGPELAKDGRWTVLNGLPSTVYRPLSVALLLIVAQLLFAASASAQAEQKLTINQIDGRGWPDIGLNITLTGPDGKAVPDVDMSQFEVLEEGVPQTPTGLALGQSKTVPLSVILAIDVSGSMSGEKLAKAKEAAIAFVGSLGPADRATLLAFNTNVAEVVPATSDHAALELGITRYRPVAIPRLMMRSISRRKYWGHPMRVRRPHVALLSS